MPESQLLHMILIGILIACFAGIVLLAVYLVATLLKRHSLHQLYEGDARDFRFVCELLRLYTDKNKLIKNPCLLRSYEGVSPRADAIVVGGGGILILTVVDDPGQYKTPVNGNWSIWQDGEMKQIPNGFLPGRQYTSVLSSILVKNGLSCPIVNTVVLTDDYAEIDSLHEENTLTCDRLVPCVREFDRRRVLSKKSQEKLIKAIRAHHELCQRQLSSAMVGNASSLFANRPELSEDEQDRKTAEPVSDETPVKKLSLSELFVEEADWEETAAEETSEAGEEGVEETPTDRLTETILSAEQPQDDGDAEEAEVPDAFYEPTERDASDD